MSTAVLDHLSVRAARRWILRLLAILFVPAIADAQTWYVDPVAGVDAPGNGSAQQPLRSLTFAMAQAPGGMTPLDLIVRSGTCSEASGEQFPIAVVPYVTIRAEEPLAARIQKDLFVLTSMFELLPGTRDVRFEGLSIAGFDRAIRAILGPQEPLILEVSGCELSTSREVVVDVTDSQATVHIERTRFLGGDRGVTINARGQGKVDLEIEGSTFQLLERGVDLATEGAASTIFASVRQTAFTYCGSQGIRTGAPTGGTLSVAVESSVFHRTAPTGGGMSSGAIVDQTPGAVSHTIHNTIFLENSHDLSGYPTGAYAVTSCMFDDPAWCSNPGSGHVCGDPLFTDAATGDFHLAPASPARDSGTAGATLAQLDIDGDPRIGGAAPDIGIDEIYDAHHYVIANPAKVGLPAKLRALGPSGSLAFLLLSASSNGTPFGPALHLALPLLTPPFAIGLVPGAAPGTGELVVKPIVPAIPALVGVVLHEQTVFLSGAQVQYGLNAVEQRFKP